jgi:phage portal protein BeeE
MPYVPMSDALSTMSRLPVSGRPVTYSGRAAGMNVMDLPAEQQFPFMSGTYLGGGVADWQENRDLYVKKYTGSTYIAIGAIARMAAMQKVKVMRRVIKGNEFSYEPVSPTHPLVELLEHVNPFDTAWDLWFYTVGWRLLTGDSFLFKAKNGFGITQQLWPMPSQWVHVIASANEFISGYQVRSGCGHDFTVPRDCMIQIKNPSLDWEGNGRYYGNPTIKAAAQSIDLENEMWKRLYHQFKNMAPPGMVISTDMRLQPAQARQLWTQLAAQYSMQSHSGRPMLLHSGMKLEGEFSPPGSRELDYKGSLDKVLEYSLAIHGVPKALAGMMDSASRCHDDQTECLTDKGWVTYNNIDHNTKVACYDPESKTIHYRKPTGVFVSDYSGKMIYVHHDRIDLMVTPNHRMWHRTHLRDGSLTDWKFASAADCLARSRYEICSAPENGAACEPAVGIDIAPGESKPHRTPGADADPSRRYSASEVARLCGEKIGTVYSWLEKGLLIASKDGWQWKVSGKDLADFKLKNQGQQPRESIHIDPDVWLEFLGWFVSEGSAFKGHGGKSSCVNICQTECKYSKVIDDLMGKMPFSVTRKVIQPSRRNRSAVVNWNIYDKSLCDHLRLHCGVHAHNKRVPDYIKDYPAESLKIFLLAAMRGDGHFIKDSEGNRTGLWRYHTVSKQLADDIMEIGIKCGYASVVRAYDRGPGNRILYVVSMRTENIAIHVRNDVATKVVDYDGKIWCLEVPTGLFVVRRCGTAHISGNSNIESAIWGFAKTTLDPILEHISQHLTQDLAREFDPNLIIMLGPSAVDSQDSLRKDIELLVKAGAVTPDEVRHLLMKLKRLEGGMGQRPVMISGFQTVNDPNNPGKTMVGRANLAPSNAETSATRSEDDRTQ